jgi:hypothetical protein
VSSLSLFGCGCAAPRIPGTPHLFPFILRFLSRRFPQDDPDAEQAARPASGMRLEPHGHLVFALGERLGNGMGDIAESAGKIEIPLLAGVGVKVGQGLLVSRDSPGFLHSDTSVFGRMVRSRVLGDKIPHSRAGGEDESAGSWRDRGARRGLGYSTGFGLFPRANASDSRHSRQ